MDPCDFNVFLILKHAVRNRRRYRTCIHMSTRLITWRPRANLSAAIGVVPTGLQQTASAHLMNVESIFNFMMIFAKFN